MRRIALLFAVSMMCLLPAKADALTFRDVIELTRAGLGEEILLALIEVDRSVFPIDAPSIKQLKEAGVSERVILAMVRSGREIQSAEQQPPADPQGQPVAPPPQVVVIEHREPEVREVPVAVPVAVPVYVPVVTRPSHAVRVHDNGTHVQSTGELSFGQTVPVSNHPVKQPEPVYWGWGGKLRPDAWQPTPNAPDRKK